MPGEELSNPLLGVARRLLVTLEPVAEIHARVRRGPIEPVVGAGVDLQAEDVRGRGFHLHATASLRRRPVADLARDPGQRGVHLRILRTQPSGLLELPERRALHAQTGVGQAQVIVSLRIVRPCGQRGHQQADGPLIVAAGHQRGGIVHGLAAAPALGVDVVIQAAYLDPSSPIGLTLTWALYPLHI